MYVYCRGTDDFQIVRRQFFKVVCEGATESREDHQHEGVGVSTELAASLLYSSLISYVVFMYY